MDRKKLLEHEFVCGQCGLKKKLTGTKTQWEDLVNKTKNIQDIFPEHSADDRELILSGICGKCFDSLFEEEI